jgi:hypothetical protein
MKNNFEYFRKILFVLVIQLSQVSCATGGNAYFHSIGFNAVSDGKIYGHADVEILDWSYGNNSNVHLHSDPYFASIGKAQLLAGVTGYYPRGDYICEVEG